jgi:hypothetical protein
VLDFDYLYNYCTDDERLKDMILFHTSFYEKLSDFILKSDVSDKIYMSYSFIVAYLTAVGLITYYCATKTWSFILQMCDVASDSRLYIMIDKSQPIF